MKYDISNPVVPFRIDSELKDALRSIAKKRNSSVNAVVKEIVYNWLEEKGYVVVTRKIQNV